MAYYTCTEYIRLADNVQQKIDRITNIIEMLEDSILEGELRGEIQEYNLDDGQTRIRTTFNSVESIERAIHRLEQRKQRLINSSVGFRYGLKDGKTITPCQY